MKWNRFPEVVENPLEKEAYFITGKVTDGTNALADVSVSAGKVSAKRMLQVLTKSRWIRKVLLN